MTMLKETHLLIGLSPNDYDTHSFCWEEVGSLILCIYIYICLYDIEFLPSRKLSHIYHPIAPTPKILHYTTLLDFGHISAGFSLVLFSVLHCLFFTYSVFMQCSFAYLLHTTIRSLSLYIYLQHFGFLHFCRQICLYDGQPQDNRPFQLNNFDVEFLKLYIFYACLVFEQIM